MGTHPRSILKTTRFRRVRGSTNADANVRSLHQEWKQICGAQCLAQAFGAPLRGFRALHFSGVSDHNLVLVGLVGLAGSCCVCLEVIAESFPSEMDLAVIRIAQALFEGVDGGGSKAPSGSVDAAELLADLAVDSKHCLALLRFTLRLMGLASGVAPKSKHVRHCCALILARLLTEAPPSTGRSQQAAFLQLALDKFAPIRLVALPGLAALGTAQTIATLVEIGCSDPIAKIRQEALVQVEMLQATPTEGTVRRTPLVWNM